MDYTTFTQELTEHQEEFINYLNDKINKLTLEKFNLKYKLRSIHLEQNEIYQARPPFTWKSKRSPKDGLHWKSKLSPKRYLLENLNTTYNSPSV